MEEGPARPKESEKLFVQLESVSQSIRLDINTEENDDHSEDTQFELCDTNHISNPESYSILQQQGHCQLNTLIPAKKQTNKKIESQSLPLFNVDLNFPMNPDQQHVAQLFLNHQIETWRRLSNFQTKQMKLYRKQMYIVFYNLLKRTFDKIVRMASDLKGRELKNQVYRIDGPGPRRISGIMKDYMQWMSEQECYVFRKILQVLYKLSDEQIFQHEVLMLYDILAKQIKKQAPYKTKIVNQKKSSDLLCKIQDSKSLNIENPGKHNLNQAKEIKKRNRSKAPLIDYNLKLLVRTYINLRNPNSVSQALSRKCPHINWSLEKIQQMLKPLYQTQIIKLLIKHSNPPQINLYTMGITQKAVQIYIQENLSNGVKIVLMMLWNNETIEIGRCHMAEILGHVQLNIVDMYRTSEMANK